MAERTVVGAHPSRLLAHRPSNELPTPTGTPSDVRRLLALGWPLNERRAPDAQAAQAGHDIPAVAAIP